MGISIAFAVALGAATGAAIHNVAIGVAFGAAFGVAADALLSFRRPSLLKRATVPLEPPFLFRVFNCESFHELKFLNPVALA
jgi:hypothetical protein